MSNYEQLMQDALKGKKNALKELSSYAGSGNAEAQYYLALYYAKKNGSEQDEDCQYWMKKAVENGYDEAKNSIIPDSAYEISEEIEESPDEGSNASLKKLLMKFSFMGRINRMEYIISILIAIILLFVVTLVEDPIIRRILELAIDVFWWSQCVRRLHDFGASGWYVLIPVVSWVFAAFPKGDKGENEYGEAPVQVVHDPTAHL